MINTDPYCDRAQFVGMASEAVTPEVGGYFELLTRSRSVLLGTRVVKVTHVWDDRVRMEDIEDKERIVKYFKTHGKLWFLRDLTWVDYLDTSRIGRKDPDTGRIVGVKL